MSIRSSKAMVAEANAVIETLAATAAVGLATDPDVVFVDVRDAAEREKTGCIGGSVAAPRGMLEFLTDPANEGHLQALSSCKRLVLYCAAGGRSALAAKTLRDMGLARVAHIAGGLPAWIAAGGAVVKA
jgi:rhodanese-related sulfurtransferase